jgi:phosphoglucosamine mutase
MSNLGLERYLAGVGLELVRTQVGDRYVLEAMRAGGYNVGGEPSGHIILSDYNTTGDGFVAALQLLAVIRVMGEGDDKILVEAVVDDIVSALSKAAA